MLQFEIHPIFCFQLMYNINIFKNMTFFINIGQKNWHFSFSAWRLKMQNIQKFKLKVISIKWLQKSGCSKILKTYLKYGFYLLPIYNGDEGVNSREHWQKTFVTLSRFWQLRGWGFELIRWKWKIRDKNLFFR